MHKPVVITSIHGFKSHGKWQKKFNDTLSCKGFQVLSFDYGYQFFSCLIPGFRKRLLKEFYKQYCDLINNRNYDIEINNPYKRPSIVAHSLGSYIICNSMLKYPDIKFDKIILCGSIVDRNFDWDYLIKRDQVFYARNEYSKNDQVVNLGWVLSHINSGQSGKRGFNSPSNYLDQVSFHYFDHGSYFEGNHITEYWIPYFEKDPPNFHILEGRYIKSLHDFENIFDQTTLIDDACYGNEPFWNDFAIPNGLAERWIDANPDIYSFLVKRNGVEEVIGYINAMPLHQEAFGQILEGKLHDQNVRPEDIMAYDESAKELNIYVMSIALKPEYQNQHLDLKEYGFTKLYVSLINKLTDYYDKYGCEVIRIAGIGWTDKGQKLCRLMGLKQTGVQEEITNKPIYLLDLERKKNTKNINKHIRKLIDYYDTNEKKSKFS